MTTLNFSSWVSKHFPEGRPGSGGQQWSECNCPFSGCGKPVKNFTICVQGPDAGSFYCFYCKARGAKAHGARYLIYFIRRMSGIESERDFEIEFDTAPSVSRKFEHPKFLRDLSTLNVTSRNYLKRRGFSVSDLQRYGGIYTNVQGNVMAVPMFGSDFFSAGWAVRRLVEGGNMRLLPGSTVNGVIMGNIPPRPSRYIVIVEGFWDALRVEKALKFTGSTLTMLGTRLSPIAFRWLINSRKRVVVWLDPDFPGRTASKRIYQKLKDEGVKVWQCKTSMDPKEYTEDQIKKILKGVISK